MLKKKYFLFKKVYQEHLLAKLVNIQPTLNELVKAQLKTGSSNFLNEKNMKKKVNLHVKHRVFVVVSESFNYRK